MPDKTYLMGGILLLALLTLGFVIGAWFPFSRVPQVAASENENSKPSIEASKEYQVLLGQWEQSGEQLKTQEKQIGELQQILIQAEDKLKEARSQHTAVQAELKTVQAQNTTEKTPPNNRVLFSGVEKVIEQFMNLSPEEKAKLGKYGEGGELRAYAEQNPLLLAPLFLQLKANPEKVVPQFCESLQTDEDPLMIELNTMMLQYYMRLAHTPLPSKHVVALILSTEKDLPPANASAVDHVIYSSTWEMLKNAAWDEGGNHIYTDEEKRVFSALKKIVLARLAPPYRAENSAAISRILDLAKLLPHEELEVKKAIQDFLLNLPNPAERGDAGLGWVYTWGFYALEHFADEQTIQFLQNNFTGYSKDLDKIVDACIQRITEHFAGRNE
ncbi:PspA/IM30 family protein [Planctomycetota bacterium]